MIVWRISEFVDLDGQGGLLVPGRWNSVGRPVVYTAGSRSLAMLETVVHLERARAPSTFQLLEIDIPDRLSHSVWAGESAMPIGLTQSWGDHWLAERSTPLARVPSVIVPGDANWLINPRHPDAAAIRVVGVARHPWDARLFN